MMDESEDRDVESLRGLIESNTPPSPSVGDAAVMVGKLSWEPI